MTKAELYCLVVKVAVNPSLNPAANDSLLKLLTAVGSLQQSKLRLHSLCSLVSAIFLDSVERYSAVDNHCWIVDVQLGFLESLLAPRKLVLVLCFHSVSQESKIDI